MVKISVIIPIFNVDKFLSQCLDSVLAQTFESLEIILVNDGSTDGCARICDEYRDKDPRIKVIHKKNGGVSSARNKGIDIATGDYLAFVDPDDVIDNNMYLKLLYAAERSGADIAVCPIKTFNHINNTTSISKVWPKVNTLLDKEIIRKEIIPSILSNKNYSLISSVNKLYKKSIFENARFDEKRNHSEDAKLNFSLLPHINGLIFIEEQLYHYHIHKRGSLTKIFREDLYEIINENKSLLVNLSQKYANGQGVFLVKNHFMNITFSYMQDVVLQKIEDRKKQKILSGIFNSREFKEEVLIYKTPSLFYSILKIISIKKYVRVFLLIVKVKFTIQSMFGKSTFSKI
ncbi:glycosyltransferase [Mesobacillus subterraneus]|uniref:glycosyltransferase n=1 Tax=Mesobacillus subterraneus TaxID=285983 RepID=UPI00203B161B|nr:glycosyltransferase [Mesobacillus subterraneus]MCM3574708.1 glycosyltransferase [Mesobacillus subterraneus]